MCWQALCANAAVSGLGSMEQINEACLDLQRSCKKQAGPDKVLCWLRLSYSMRLVDHGCSTVQLTLEALEPDFEAWARIASFLSDPLTTTATAGLGHVWLQKDAALCRLALHGRSRPDPDLATSVQGAMRNVGCTFWDPAEADKHKRFQVQADSAAGLPHTQSASLVHIGSTTRLSAVGHVRLRTCTPSTESLYAPGRHNLHHARLTALMHLQEAIAAQVMAVSSGQAFDTADCTSLHCPWRHACSRQPNICCTDLRMQVPRMCLNHTSRPVCAFRRP